VARRDRGPKEKEFPTVDEFMATVAGTLEEIQSGLLERATKLRDAHTKPIDSKEEFYEFFTPKDPEKPEIHGGFALAHWNGSAEVERKIKDDLKVTIRCIPFPGAVPGADEPGKCVITGEPSPRRVIFAKAY
jgi:prolyl-tRNA synthetase